MLRDGHAGRGSGVRGSCLAMATMFSPMAPRRSGSDPSVSRTSFISALLLERWWIWFSSSSICRLRACSSSLRSEELIAPRGWSNERPNWCGDGAAVSPFVGSRAVGE